jgi:hypothetical protein
MKRFSLLISLVVIPFVLFSQIKQNDEKINFFKQGDLSKYNISIQTEKAEITGILFLKILMIVLWEQLLMNLE